MNQAFSNFTGQNSSERFELFVTDVEYVEGKSVLMVATLTEYEDAKRETVLRHGQMKIGFDFHLSPEYGQSRFIAPMLGLTACYIVAEMAHAVAKVTFNFNLTDGTKKFIEDTVGATSSWNRHFFGTAPVQVVYGTQSQVCVDLQSEDKQMGAGLELDYNKVVLGASGGKESTINDIIFKGAGYEVIPVTFKTEDERDGNACVELIWWNSEEAFEIHTPRAMPDASKAFDAQSMLSIPRYGLLAVTAVLNGAGILGVGTEFGCSKIWRAGEHNNAFDVHDFSVDEGAYVARCLEAFFQNFGVEVHMVAPTAVLHELGILRALHDHGFDLTQLKSCWMAHSLNVNFCGACLKCQRIKRYASVLQSRHSSIKLNDQLQYPYIGITEGTMLSYSMQYHLLDDYPELPWDTALILDSDGFTLTDYRDGARIIQFLRDKMGFKDTIELYPLKNPLELRLKDVSDVRQSIKNVVGVDYLNLQQNGQPIKHKAFLRLPFEDLLYQSLDEEVISFLPDDFNYQGVMARYDWIPMWEPTMDTWVWLNITGVDIDKAVKLELKVMDSAIFKTWMKHDALMGGMDFLKVNPHSIVYMLGGKVDSVQLLRGDEILAFGGKWLVNPHKDVKNSVILKDWWPHEDLAYIRTAMAAEQTINIHGAQTGRISAAAPMDVDATGTNHKVLPRKTASHKAYEAAYGTPDEQPKAARGQTSCIAHVDVAAFHHSAEEKGNDAKDD